MIKLIDRLLTAHPIPYCYYDPSKEMLVQPHDFANASKLAYAGVVYLRTVSSDTTVSTSLVMAKTRVVLLLKHKLFLVWNYVLQFFSVSF